MRLADNEDMAFINELAQHPDIAPHIGEATARYAASDYMDMGPAVQPIVYDGIGAVLFERYHDDTLESHVMFLPGHRGKEAFNACKEAALWAFCDTPCEEIVTKCPISNKRAYGMCMLMGFREICRDSEYTYHSLPISHWLLSGVVDPMEFVERCVNGYGYLKALVIYNRVARLMLAEPARLVDGAVAIGELRFNIEE